MKSIILLAVVTLAYAKSIEQAEPLSAYGYNRRVAIPLGEEIRKEEEAYLGQVANGRIAGGLPSQLGQFPYQAGVLTNFIGVSGTGVCGGSLVTANRVIHAAHCWYDGELQGYTSTVVLGSTTIFFGGTRMATSNIIMHPEWNTELIRNDVAVIYLPNSVQFSNTIAPIALPSGSQLNELFAGETAIASGFGRTGDSVSGAISFPFQSLRHVSLPVITNAVCFLSFPRNVVDSNVCTSGANSLSTCSGDSGGPLVVTRNNQPLLIGITSFGNYWGCQLGTPAAFARVTSFMSFFNQHL